MLSDVNTHTPSVADPKVVVEQSKDEEARGEMSFCIHLLIASDVQSEVNTTKACGLAYGMRKEGGIAKRQSIAEC